jgi:hypothetical protein
MNLNSRRRWLAVAAGGLLGLAGCSRSPGVADFTPPADNARRALEAALNHWQAGHKPGTVPGVSAPAVEVVDSKWKAGQQLRSFEVLKEEAPGPGPRYFTVRLTPPKGPAQEVRYAVLGIDPIWVYREDDYRKLTGAGM